VPTSEKERRMRKRMKTGMTGLVVRLVLSKGDSGGDVQRRSQGLIAMSQWPKLSEEAERRIRRSEIKSRANLLNSVNAFFAEAPADTLSKPRPHREVLPFFDKYVQRVLRVHAKEYSVHLFDPDTLKPTLRRLLRELLNTLAPRPDVRTAVQLTAEPALPPPPEPAGVWEEVLGSVATGTFTREKLPSDFERRFVYILRQVPEWQSFRGQIRSNLRSHLRALETTVQGQGQPSQATPDILSIPTADSVAVTLDNPCSGGRPSPVEVIGAWLVQHGETKKNLAGRVGIARGTLDRICKGERIHPAKISDLARALDCDFRDLVPREPAQYNSGSHH